MKLCRCPVCHSDINLDQLIEDDAGRELLGLMADLKSGVGRPLVSYIALFRPAKSALSNSRAVKLMREVLDMYPQSPLLAQALSETVQSVSKKRRVQTNIAQLNNHNYLKQVYDSQAPKFAGSIALHNTENNNPQQSELDKKYNAFAYITQMRSFGQPVEHLPYYQEWVKWQQQLGGVND